jgi:hypothetical protein
VQCRPEGTAKLIRLQHSSIECNVAKKVHLSSVGCNIAPRCAVQLCLEALWLRRVQCRSAGYSSVPNAYAQHVLKGLRSVHALIPDAGMLSATTSS